MEKIRLFQSFFSGLSHVYGTYDPASGRTWQVKENMRSGGEMVPTNFERLMKIVHESKYTGYFPIETLGEGDPLLKVRKLVERISPYFN